MSSSGGKETRKEWVVTEVRKAWVVTRATGVPLAVFESEHEARNYRNNFTSGGYVDEVFSNPGLPQ